MSISRTPEVGDYLATPYGTGMVTGIDWSRMRVSVSVLTEGEIMPNSCRIIWVLLENVLDSDYLDVDFSDPDTAERFLNGETVIPEVEVPKAAVNIPCTCGCGWCNRISSNGFHMANRGECDCDKKSCPCLTGDMYL